MYSWLFGMYMASCLPTRNAWTGVVAVLRWDLMPICSPLIEKGLSVRCVVIPLRMGWSHLRISVDLLRMSEVQYHCYYLQVEVLLYSASVVPIRHCQAATQPHF